MLKKCLPVSAVAALLCWIGTLAFANFETSARAVFIYDVATGTVLFEKNAQTPLPPASMSKIMTLNMMFEAVTDGRVSLDTRFRVSDRAHAMGGSTMFLDQTDRPTVDELIKGIIVQSGNDASVVAAEGLAGSEEAFARLMNERGVAIGLKNSTFVNSTGWPNPNHRMSMEDLGLIATRLVTEFPELYANFALREWEYDGRAPDNRFNRNPLLGLGIGGDGLKTGHTDEAGFGLVGSAVQGNRRVVFVFTGLDSARARADEAERVVSWAFRQFVEVPLAAEDDVIARADVWMGDQTQINLVVPEDFTVLVPATQRDAGEARVEYRGPLEAPITQGDTVAELVFSVEGLSDRRIPLVADRDVAFGGFLPRIRAASSLALQYAMEQVASFRE